MAAPSGDPGETSDRPVQGPESVFRIWFDSISRHHRGKALGILIGLAISLMIRILGFFWAIFVVLCVAVGYFIGKRLDEDRLDVWDYIDELLPRHRR